MTDREISRLLGPVRSIHTEIVDVSRESYFPSYTATFNETGNIVKEAFYAADGQLSEVAFTKYDAEERKVENACYKASGGLVRSTIYTYDPDGKEIGRIYTSAYGLITKQRSIPTYDNSGNKTEETWYYDDGTRSHKYTYVYDLSGRIVEQILYKYGDDSSLEEISRSTYDSSGNIVESASFNAEDQLIDAKYVYKYDSKGNVNEHVEYASDGTVRNKISYSYQFDHVGNWVEQIKRDTASKADAQDVTRRTIRYYSVMLPDR